MKYNKEEFDKAVSYYKEKLPEGKNAFISFSRNDKRAFYSTAPLSRALSEKGYDVHVLGYGQNTDSLDVLNEIWKLYEDLKNNVQNEKTKALKAYIDEVSKKIPEFFKLFEKPDLVLSGSESGFGDLEFKQGWMKEYRDSELMQTAHILWRDVYNIKENERVGVGFELIGLDEMLGHPLEDYLDSYPICWAMNSVCPGKVVLGASSKKDSMMVNSEKVSDLRTTLLGCELDKNIDEEPFLKFKTLSKVMHLNRIRPGDASFFVSGKGYPGKHLFGDAIGYPSADKTTKWKSPGQMIYKFDFVPQTKFESRDPLSRVAFTETLPIDVFIDTNLVDWNDIRARNQKVKEVMDKCDVIFVKSNIKEKDVTNLEVGLVKKNGERRWVKRSDTDVREKINKEYLEKTGIRAGCMGNIPGGEAFTTPEYIKGTFVGDVVISVDQSYPLSEKEPFVVECFGDNYKIKSAPKDILKKFETKKKEAWDLLIESEKNKSLPQDIIDLKKSNFERIGEFAINTNPKAKLCDYLIVNEKIAKMMHIALGSGYEEDRSTDYHVDIVFNAPRQKLDVYGTDTDGNEHWILKSGEFVA